MHSTTLALALRRPDLIYVWVITSIQEAVACQQVWTLISSTLDC